MGDEPQGCGRGQDSSKGRDNSRGRDSGSIYGGERSAPGFGLSRMAIGFALIGLILFIAFTGGTSVFGMSLGTHMMVGAGLGYEIANGSMDAFAIGVASHALLDAIPHRDDLEWVQVILLVGGAIATNDLYNRSNQDKRVLWGAIGGLLPDIEHFLVSRGIIRRDQRIFPSHIGIIKQPRAPGGTGAVIELGLNGLALVLLF